MQLSRNSTKKWGIVINKHIVWAWAVKNIVAIICWTALAIFFGKWWIALFGALFVNELKHSKTSDEKENSNNESEN